MTKYGKPASMLTYHGPQFYANAGEGKKNGESIYEEELLKLGIKHILARVRHPQTNGKLYPHGKIQCKLSHFETLVGHDKAIDTFMNLYNYEWIHMSDETPWESYQRKKAPEGTIDWTVKLSAPENPCKIWFLCILLQANHGHVAPKSGFVTQLGVKAPQCV